MRFALLSMLLALSIASLADGRAPRVDPTATVSWHPDRPVQGHLFVVRVTPGSSSRLVRVSGEAAGEPLHFARLDDGAFEGLAAAPIDSPGSLGLSLTLYQDDGSTVALRPSVPLVEGDYQYERLTVAPRLGAPPNAEDQARLARDQARAREVSHQSHRTPRLWNDAVVLPRRDRVTSGFGNGRIFNDQVSSRHMGLDLDGEPGDTVRATTRGVVALVDDFLLAGRIVYLNHGAGLVSGYFHLSEQLVAEGDTVEAGTPIGRVGATGRVTGPHLHWVVRYGAVSVDPRSLPGLSELPPTRP
jgi:murein DD-endopeptidase MepM/ murein hydrolase activator NlpD